jgi:hypothetical protein
MSAVPARAPDPGNDYAETTLEYVRQAIQVEDEVLKEARKRRNKVKELAELFAGVLRTYDAGSIAHGTAKNPLPDADGGSVLDRRHHPNLGPDGGGHGPTSIVEQTAAFIYERLRSENPRLNYEISKRAIVFSFNDPIDDEDPKVDLIVALTRKDAPGLWIPNTEQDSWDASDPEKHTQLLTAPPDDLRVFRARIVRVVKVAVEQDGNRAVVISFNVEALALTHVTEVTGMAEGVRDYLWAAADDIAVRLTPDPAGVSPPIKLPEGITHETAARRLRFFGDRVAEAIEHRADEQRVLEALAAVFPEQLPHAPLSEKSNLARALRGGNTGPAVQVALGSGAERLKPTRSYGDGHEAA